MLEAVGGISPPPVIALVWNMRMRAEAQRQAGAS